MTNIKKYLLLYLLIYGILLFAIISNLVPSPTGEWDDYTLTTASILNDHNFTVSADDIEYAKIIFPEWKDYYKTGTLSNFYDDKGAELPYYFGTYSLACAPMVLLLNKTTIPANYAFVYTNLFVLLISLYILILKRKKYDIQSIIMVLILSINPVLWYLKWNSAEVFMYSMVMIAMIFWMDKEYKRAAIFISVAGTLNITIMIMGIVMISDYLGSIYEIAKPKNKNDIYKIFIKEWKSIIAFGSCFIIGIIPMIYNYIMVGNINLTAAHEDYLISDTPTWKRMIAYLFDLNFGMLPYFNYLFILSLLFIVIAILKKQWIYISIMIGFLMTVYTYSIMIHINSGMTGIARYNLWSAPIFIIVVITYHDILITKKTVRMISKGLIIFTIVFMTLILQKYSSKPKNNLNHTSMTSIAKYVLDNRPELYNPLFSTFNSRVEHIDGGYKFNCPIYYEDDNKHIRKILVSSDCISKVKDDISGSESDIKWLDEKLDKINKTTYVSIEKSHNLFLCPSLKEDNTIWFYGNNWNADKYIKQGISRNENSYTWTNGKEIDLLFRISGYTIGDKYKMSIKQNGVYNGTQSVYIYNNDNKVFSGYITLGGFLDCKIEPDKFGIVNIKIKVPDAISPKELGKSDDNRELALKLVKASIKKIN